MEAMKEQVWACEAGQLEAYLDIVENLASRDLSIKAGIFDDIFDEKPDSLDVDAEGMATININGVLTMSGPSPIAKLFGATGTGYSSILDKLDEIQNRPDVRAVTLAINSPGGEVQGVDTVWSKIMEVRKTKPVGALNTGMMASAAFYLASAANTRMGISPTVETGSIGAVISGIDDSKAAEKAGYRRVNVYSKNAPNKGIDLGTDQGRALLQARVDAFEAVFHQRIMEGMGITADKIKADFGQGAVMIASHPDAAEPDAIKLGLLDGIANAFKPVPGVNLMAAEIVNHPAVAGEKTQEGNKMKLSELLAQNPEAAAELEAIKAAQSAEFAAKAEKVGKILASESYASNAVLRVKGFEVLAGKISVDAFDGMVAMADMMAAEKALAAEQSSKLPETPGQAEAASDLMAAEVAKLGLNIDQIRAYAKATGVSEADAIKAAIDNQKIILADKGV